MKGYLRARRYAFALLATVAMAFAITPVAAADSAPTREQEQFEKKFLASTIDHHFLAVKMG